MVANEAKFDENMKQLRRTNTSNTEGTVTNLDRNSVCSSSSRSSSIVLEVNKGMLFKLLLMSTFIGIVIGILISTIFFSFKVMDIRQEYMNKTLQTRTELEQSKQKLSGINKHNLTLSSSNEELLTELERAKDELEIFYSRKELLNKYEYVLMTGKNRTDVTYEQLQFGVDEMVKRDLNPHLLYGIIKLESNGNEKAKNPKSTATGYCQFLKGTGKWVYEKHLNKGKYNHTMALDGYVNIEMGAEYISYLMKKYNGDIMKSMLEYNGSELGEAYYHKVDNILKSGANINLAKIQQQYKTKV